MSSSAKFVWLDGEFIPWDRAKVHVLTQALNYGTGVFEGIRAYLGDDDLYIFRLRDHIRRLLQSARVYLLSVPFNEQEIYDAVIELMRRNEMRQPAYIRPLIFKSGVTIVPYLLGTPTSISISAVPFERYFDKPGVACCISSWRRIDEGSMPPAVKACGNYLNSVIAQAEALQSGFDEAILLDHEGYVSEATGENVFIVRDSQIITPPVSGSILRGITRDSAIRIAQDLGYSLIERNIARTELYVCEEAFLTGTAAEITPLLSVDRIPIGDGQPGPISLRLKEAYHRAVRGLEQKYLDWVTPVHEKKILVKK